MKLSVKKIAVVASSLLVVLAAVLIGVSIYKNRPENVAIKSVSGALTQLAEREEIALLYDTLREGSLSVSVEAWRNESGRDELDGGEISGTLHFSDKAFMLKDFFFRLDGTKLGGDFYLSDNFVYLSEDELLGGAYGIPLDEFAEDFMNSIFAYDSGSDYEIPKDLSDSIENLTDGENITEDVKKLYEEIMKELWSIFCASVTFESATEDVKLGGESVAARVIRITVTEEELANFLEATLEYAEESEDVEAFVVKYGEILGAAMGFYDYVGRSEELFEEFLDELACVIEDLRESADDFDPITVEITTPKNKSELLLFRVKTGKKTVVLLDCGKAGVAKTDKITLEIYGDTFSYEIKNDDDKRFRCVLENGAEEFFSVDVNKKKGTFTVSLGEEDDGYTVEGSYEKDGKTTTLHVEEVIERYYSWYYGMTENRYTTEMTVVIKQKDKMPDAPKDYDRISDLSEKDFEDFWQEVRWLF